MWTRAEGIPRRLLVVVTALLAVLMAGLPASPVKAAVTRGDYLPKSVVKAKMAGTGTWYRALGEPNVQPLGATPPRCRSDLPIARARETRDAFYWGSVPASPKYYGQARVTIARFTTKRAAKRAIRKVSKWVPACPRVVEWSCENCDGIAEFRRSPAKQRKVGTQSFSWNERSVGMGKSNGRAIAARRGRTVVIVVVSHQTDPTRMKTPVAPTWRKAVVVARRSLNRAVA